MEEREIVVPYAGTDIKADTAAWLQTIAGIEKKYLLYFKQQPPMFEDDLHGHLKYHFFFTIKEGKVLLLEAESSNLPPSIVNEVQAAFRSMFEPVE